MTFSADKMNSIRAIGMIACALLLCSSSFAGLIVLDIESASFDSVDSISAPSPEQPVQPLQPVVENDDSNQSSFDETNASANSTFSASAFLQTEFLFVANNASGDGWIRESNRCRSKTSPFDLLRPPQAIK